MLLFLPLSVFFFPQFLCNQCYVFLMLQFVMGIGYDACIKVCNGGLTAHLYESFKFLLSLYRLMLLCAK